MSNNTKDTIIRQLPPGKLQNIKKHFEDVDKEKTEKPIAPIKPQTPQTKVWSPAHQPAIKKYPAPPVPSGQPKQSPAKIKENESSEELKSRKYSGDSTEPKVLGANVAGRISCIEMAALSSPSSGLVSPGASYLKPNLGHQQVDSQSDPVRVHRAFSDVSDLYAKVNKNKTDSSQDRVTDLQRKEAIRKNSEERRKTVATINCDFTEHAGVSVASRTKLFAGQKPATPVKPEAVKRQTSLGTTHEDDQPKSQETKLSQGNEYNLPWDMFKSSLVEDFKKHKFPTSQNSTSPANNVIKSSQHLQKPPLPIQPPKISDLRPQNSAAVEMRRNSGPLRATGAANDPPAQTKESAPPKPPRTHAHDDYMKVKLFQGDSKSNSEGQVKKILIDEAGSNKNNDTEYLSVKDRISKMHQKTESPPCLFGKNQNAQLRGQPPSRPPPPKVRPNSGGTPAKDNKFIITPKTFSKTALAQEEGPVIIPLSISRNASQLRKPSDELPPEPGSGKRFPLRKSYSSECLHSSRGSSLNFDDDDKSLNSCEMDFEAVLDPDGYAIPHEFMKLPTRRRQFSDQNDNANENVSPAQFLTKLQGFGKDPESEQNGQFDEPWMTSAQDQTLDKVTKKKMTMVKQKINQAYADVSVALRGAVEKQADVDEDWIHIDRDEAADSEVIVEPNVLKKRIEHCKSVKLNSNKSTKKKKEYLNAIYPQLFEYCLIVGLQVHSDTGYKPVVLHKFPENVSSNLSVPSFCFPDAASFKPGYGSAESYSFVMTYEDGTRVYGYCRRLQPPDTSLPEVICIISPIDAFNMYNMLLAEIEKRRLESTDLATELIAASFGRPLPSPGKLCHIRTLDSKGDMETIYLSRPYDNKLENVNYESPLRFLGTDKLVRVFASMLMERRIILCSSHLSVLTQTVHALVALLYPFQWQHVYVPLLPSEMLEVGCAPMPYILGILSSFVPDLCKMDLEKVFIVDLDKKDIILSEGDENSLLPRKIQRALKTAINMCKIDSEAQNAQWLMVAEAFLRMFIETVGHFTNHIQIQQDNTRIFQKDGFIAEVVSKEHRQFLQWFTETQMFENFIGNYIEQTDHGTNDLFMQRLAEYRESKEESKRKGLGAKVKNLKKALKTKLTS